ncbi:Uracil nucleotide/cysteinyl leukotriene receptor [Labeo rohita]|uniref:Uracil nucleotide/cysteinyl leukotriene receptor n=1 Tax=Labeo rohita TaxID=84645 RepID=A0ABQ8LLL2_LABRO|nr:Uracil nucleotide/cysteinyl leukotriene receptor [Labeo rohita]
MDVFDMSQSNINKTKPFIDFNTPGYILCLIVGFPENLYVIWLIVTGAGNGVASEFFSLNLSVCEILLCLQSLLSLLCGVFPTLFQVVGFLLGICISGRPLFQCLICVDCYLAVVHPITFLKFKPLRYRVICCAVAWIMIVFACVILTLNSTGFQMHLFLCCCLGQAVLTLSVKLFCCVAVLRALKQSGPGERRSKEKAKENHMKRRAFNIIVMIILAVLLIYAAYLAAAIIYILTHQFISELWVAGNICFVLGGLVQPLLYLHRTGRLPFCKAP